MSKYFANSVITRNLAIFCLTLSLGVGKIAVANDELKEPTAEAINNVFYYYHSGEKVLLSAMRTCKEIGEEKNNSFECINQIDPTQAIQRYTENYYWLSLMVPLRFTGVIEFTFYHNNKKINTSKIEVSPSLRYRVWKFMPTHLAGTWKIEVNQILLNSRLPIDKLTYKVQ